MHKVNGRLKDYNNLNHLLKTNKVFYLTQIYFNKFLSVMFEFCFSNIIIIQSSKNLQTSDKEHIQKFVLKNIKKAKDD